jgi:hypothetical protein
MTNAYPTEARRAALTALQAQFAFLFPAAHADPGLEAFAVVPGAAMEQSYQTYFDFVEATVKPRQVLDMWPVMDESEIDTFFSEAVALDGPLPYKDPSVNAVVLHALTLKDARLVTLADGGTSAVLKSQPYRGTAKAHPGTLNNALFEFTTEVIMARLLNALVTAFPYTVTPHFATFLGCFRSATLTKAKKKKKGARVFALFERAHVSLNTLLEDLFEQEAITPAQLGALVFMVLFTLAAASHVAGAALNDMHLGNVMVRYVTGTKYAGAHWAYKLLGEARYVILPPSAHGNRMVEIIDLGRATLTDAEPDSASSTNAHRFVQDVLTMLEDVLATYQDVCQPEAGGGSVRDVMDQLNARYRHWKTAGHTPEGARAIYQKWHTNDAQYGLGFLFAAFVGVPAPRGVQPLIVGITPSDNLLAVADDALATQLARLWKVPRREARAYSPERCRVCASPAVHTTEEKTLGFCGLDCFQVHYGHMRR